MEHDLPMLLLWIGLGCVVAFALGMATALWWLERNFWRLFQERSDPEARR